MKLTQEEIIVLRDYLTKDINNFNSTVEKTLKEGDHVIKTMRKILPDNLITKLLDEERLKQSTDKFLEQAKERAFEGKFDVIVNIINKLTEMSLELDEAGV